MIISVQANQLRVGDKLVHTDHTYNRKVTKLVTLPNGNVEITMGKLVRTVAASTECGVSR